MLILVHLFSRHEPAISFYYFPLPSAEASIGIHQNKDYTEGAPIKIFNLEAKLTFHMTMLSWDPINLDSEIIVKSK